jgi:hypothetical protein
VYATYALLLMPRGIVSSIGSLVARRRTCATLTVLERHPGDDVGTPTF